MAKRRHERRRSLEEQCALLAELTEDFRHDLLVMREAFIARQPDARERVLRRLVQRQRTVVVLQALAIPSFHARHALERAQNEILALQDVLRDHSQRPLPLEVPRDRRTGEFMPGPTPETQLKIRLRIVDDPVRRLRSNGTIDGTQAAAAEEIREVHDAVGSPIGVRVQAMDGAGGRPGHSGAWMGPQWSALMTELHAQRYMPWCRYLDETSVRENELAQWRGSPLVCRRLPFVFEIVIQERSLSQARADAGIGRLRAVEWLRHALSNYARRMK